LVFTGLGPATPFLFVVPVFAFSSLAAWRNVRLWYRQGSDFEDRLHQLEEEEAGKRQRLAVSPVQSALGPLTGYADTLRDQSNPHR
jgi:hypothetical protein